MCIRKLIGTDHFRYRFPDLHRFQLTFRLFFKKTLLFSRVFSRFIYKRNKTVMCAILFIELENTKVCRLLQIQAQPKEFIPEMSKKELGNSSVLLNLYHNKLLVSKVDEALDEGKSYDYIIAFCKEKFSFDINKSALSRYKEKRREAIENGLDLESLLDKRRKSGKIIDIKSKEVQPVKGAADPNTKALDAVETIYNDVEVLDQIIEKGFAGLQFVEAVEPTLAMKAIEVKAKITGNQLQGVSLAGLRELRLRQSAKEDAMTAIIMKFIPKELHEEVYATIEEAEREFYENLDLTEEDRRITQALEKAGYADFNA